MLTFAAIFLGSKLAPKFCIPLANLDNGLVSVFNCLSAFSLCEPLKFNVKSLSDELRKALSENYIFILFDIYNLNIN